MKLRSPRATSAFDEVLLVTVDDVQLLIAGGVDFLAADAPLVVVCACALIMNIVTSEAMSNDSLTRSVGDISNVLLVIVG